MRRLLFTALPLFLVAFLIYLSAVFVPSQAAYNRALAEIRAAAAGDTTTLDLRTLALTHLPPKLAHSLV